MTPTEQSLSNHYKEVRKRLGFKSAAVPVSRSSLAKPRRPKDIIYLSSTPSETLTYPKLPVEKWKQIVFETIRKHDVTLDMIHGSGRTKQISSCRMEIAYRLVTELGMSTTQAGKKCGYADHTTAIWAVREFARRYGAPHNIRTVPEMEADRKIRNADIYAKLISGQTVSELALENGLTKSRVRIIAKQMGFDFGMSDIPSSERRARGFSLWVERKKHKDIIRSMTE